jgi:hypothetical protein
MSTTRKDESKGGRDEKWVPPTECPACGSKNILAAEHPWDPSDCSECDEVF